LESDTETEYWLGVALMRAGRWEVASEHFEGLINSKGLLLANALTVYWVLAHYEQAACYEKLAQSTQAMQRLREFLSIWKESDPETIQVQEARTQLQALSNVAVPNTHGK
jgi:hypothetical protein